MIIYILLDKSASRPVLLRLRSMARALFSWEVRKASDLKAVNSARIISFEEMYLEKWYAPAGIRTRVKSSAGF